MTTGYAGTRLSQRTAYEPEPLISGRRRHLAAMIAEIVPDWSVEMHYDEHGKAAIVIMPDDLDDASGPTFIVYASGSAFHLDELRADTYRRLGEHRAWADILRAVKLRLIWETPFPTTLH